MTTYSLDAINALLGEEGSGYKIDYKKELNKEQYEAVNVKNGPCLVIAGAGTGKTRTLVHRLAKLIEDGVSPENILLLTFTKKAANEMEVRARKLLNDESVKNITSGTYHSFAALILRKFGKKIGIESNFTIADSEDVKDIIDLVKERLHYNEKGMLFPKSKELMSIFSMNVNKEYSIEYIIQTYYPKYQYIIADIENCYSGYKKYKRERNILDYDDILVYFYDLLRKNDDLVLYLAKKYQYLMIDEYQDSNILQFKIIKELCKFGHTKVGVDENGNDIYSKNCMVVGDDQQSIYGFRGANFKNILNFPKQFEGCKVVMLKENYRSTQEILDFSNEVTRGAKYKYDKNLFSNTKRGNKPYLVNVYNQRDESKYVLQRIMEYVAEGVPLNDIAVLIRGAFNSVTLEVDLTRLNIPYVKMGGIKFLEQAHIKDLLAYFKVMTNIYDEVAWFRILRLYDGIGPKYAKKIVDRILSDGMEVLNSTEFTRFKYGRHLPGIYKILTETRVLGFDEQIEYFIKNHFSEVLKVNYKEDSEKREEDSYLLVPISEKYKSASSFLTDLLLDSPSVEDEENEHLTISTIHSSKGLEFKKVFVLSCVEGIIPSGLAMDNEEDLEEERRIFYVAITRAADELHLLVPKTIMRFGQFEVPSISRFISDGDSVEKYLETIDVS